MRFAKLWEKLFGVQRTVVEGVAFDDDEEVIVAAIRPRKGATRRCGVCQRRCARYDSGDGRRRWRSLDLGTIKAYLEADAPRVTCSTHGVVVASVPGPATAPATPMPSTTRWPGWRRTARSRPCASSCGSPGAPSAPSSPGWSPTPGPPRIPSRTSGASASTRSPTRRATSI
jgi:transposase